MRAKITKRYLDYNGLQYLIEKIKKGIPFILKPTLTNQYDLGQTDKQWKNIYGENVYQNKKQVVDTIKMNGSTTALTNTNGTVVIPTVAGPQGPRGEQGPVGPAAGFGTPTATTTVLAENANPTVSVTASGTNTSKVFAFTFGLPKGYQGKTGLQGDKGATGVTGPRGVQGATGPVGDKGQTGSKGATGVTGPRGVQGSTGGAGFIASVDRPNFTTAEWNTYGTVGHQDSWSKTTVPAGMIAGDLFVVTGCATDTGDGYQLVYKYDPTYQPTLKTLRGTCVSSHIIARKGATGTIGGVTVSGSGNAVTGATLSGGTLTLTKGTSFLPTTGGTVNGRLDVSSINVVNGISDGQLKWITNTDNGASPIDMSMSSYMRANRLAFARPAGITIEYSNNNGSSWTNYGASDGEKQQLVTYKDIAVFRLGKKTSTTTTTADQLRITLNAVSMGVYTDMKKIFIYFSTAGANCRLTIQYQLFTDSNTTWHTHLSNTRIGGESGWNCYAFDKTFGGFNASETRAFIKNLRLIFTTTSASPRVSPSVYGLALYGPNVWVAPSNQARFDTLYSSDYAQHMMLPNGAYPDTTLVGELGNSSHVWSGAYIKTLNVTDKCNATNGFFQTSDIRKKNIKEELDLEKCYEMLDKCQEVLYTLKGDNKEQIGMIAQDVEEFFPEIISTDKDGFKSIDYAKLSVICLRIVKDLYKRVLLLENK